MSEKARLRRCCDCYRSFLMWSVRCAECKAKALSALADPDVCTNCNGSGWDATWHAGATAAEPHACGYCQGGTYSGYPLSSRTSVRVTPGPQEQR